MFSIRDGGGSIGAEELAQVSFLSVGFWLRLLGSSSIAKYLVGNNFGLKRLKTFSVFIILQILESDFIEVMRTFGWTPTDEELKDMVNVIDQVEM